MNHDFEDRINWVGLLLKGDPHYVGDAVSDTLNPPAPRQTGYDNSNPPSIKFEGTFNEFATEARGWCSSVTDFDDVHVEPVVSFSDTVMICSRVASNKTRAECLQTEECRAGLRELANRDAGTVINEYLPIILTRLNEFNTTIDCQVNMEAFPWHNEEVVYDSDISRILEWEEKEFARLHECIKSGIHRNYDLAWPFIETLFSDVAFTVDHPITAGAVSRRRASVDDSVFTEPLTQLYDEIQIAAGEQHAQNVNTWDSYTRIVLKPKLKKGRRIDRQIEKEEALAAYEEEHGFGPDDMCSYDDGRGARRYKCADGQPSDRSNSIFRELNQQLEQEQQARNEKARQLQDAYISIILQSKKVKPTKQREAYQPDPPAKKQPIEKSDCPKGAYFGERFEYKDSSGKGTGRFGHKFTTDPTITGICDHAIK